MLALTTVIVESLIACIPVVFLFEYTRARPESKLWERMLALFLVTALAYLVVYVIAHGRFSLLGEPAYQSPIHDRYVRVA